ncbi:MULTISPECIES: sensor histidine kinase [unclassified Bradyrhizobium]|uniref:sensor histidine kinase n=1 Tax=unclassified Bradyrhizobium TaxID=2631580 RepID=UPI001BA93D85|nr:MULTISPECIES: histidine kinase dimerization/phosphoacceptor domain -containing protein [unclassified Bradyrhizobium]MBR1208913.1 GAF domain-containing protein [Bradyrhizobium sp. AUGA SZCCT0124]MBR1317079.1 GAF domain-containing protein [Bradyrhizobium sp. AUGA SZCCT0051]MBR1345605.1 GAF domain-containing protein [Bradyrhizobium sp. AUGA SZCCT0105]MBR1360325.1 GAF domain-containing protein [Bradyrhizobium sp. AUGA SZCCT0045]
MPIPPGKESVSPPSPATEVTRQELPYRLRQQSLLGEFGRSAMQTRDIGQILQRATELCAEGLEIPCAKVLEYMPDDKRLLVRAGVGWRPGTIGEVSLGIDMESPAGYAFHTGQLVLSNHLQAETRFRTPKLLSDHGIKRAINVLIARGGEGHLPFGVLEADSPDPGQFDRADADFLAGFAGLLGIAIERQHADADLKEALDHQAMLTREMSHRVKNSLASVVGLLHVQGRNAESEDVRNALEDAAARITTIAQVHDHLWRSTRIGFVDIADFAGELCRKLQETVAHRVSCAFDSLMISADKAIPLGLLINEIVTNSAKHAYPNESGEIRVSGARHATGLRVEVSDQGIGLPKDFDIDQPRASLGFKVIKSLIAQLEARIAVTSNSPKGVMIHLDVPLDENTP